MALSRGRLSIIQNCPTNATVGIVTVANSKKVYIKSIVAHVGGASGVGTATCSLHIVPNSGSASNSNRIFDLDIALKETILLEPAYPIVLETTGESLQADAGVNTVNIVVNGDVEV